MFYYEKKELTKEQFDNASNFKQNRLFTGELKKIFKSAGFEDIDVKPVIVRPPIFMRGKSEIPIIPPFLEKLVLLLLKPLDYIFSNLERY